MEPRLTSRVAGLEDQTAVGHNTRQQARRTASHSASVTTTWATVPVIIRDSGQGPQIRGGPMNPPNTLRRWLTAADIEQGRRRHGKHAGPTPDAKDGPGVERVHHGDMSS